MHEIAGEIANGKGATMTRDPRDTALIPETEDSALAIRGIAPRLADEIEAARSYRARSKAANTVRAYDSDWQQFEGWCWQRELEPLPAVSEAVATYLAALAQAGRADSTIARHLAAIAWRHRQAGEVAPQHRDPRDVIADTLAGIRREQRARPTRKKTAILAADLARMIAAAEGQSSRAVRDRAVMALGLAAALRRSELVALQLADLELVREGLKLTIRHSKTDQEGQGQVIAVPSGKVLKPVARLNAWLAIRGGEAGPLFYGTDAQGKMTDQPMSDRAVARLIQRYAEKVGLDPAVVGAHSLRSGFLTEAAKAGASLPKMQEVSRQKKVEVLLGYVRDAALFENHAGDSFL
ncbi:Tyrosine recombinase XerC [Novosphingobium sp. CECT 9465]|nr:Tyrosine recombinase XerC [Novosphingobium sp. CECT 9465]